MERNSKILLIDDDKDLCHLTKMALTKHGYEVVTAQDAATGVKYAQDNRPNLILMDVLLPGASGAEAVGLLRKNPQLKNIPIVFLTALMTGEEKNIQDEGLNIQGLNYPALGKPYDIEDLLDVVRKYAKP